MRITSRTKAIVFFITLGACLVALTIVANVSWIVLNGRRIAPLVLGLIFFCVIIAGLVVNTVFLVREIRRNERQDSFLNAVTHELKTPIASIRLYLETLESRQLDDAQRQDFFRIMLNDTDRLLDTVEQVLKAGELRHRSNRDDWHEVELNSLVEEAMELTRLRHHLGPEALRFGDAPRDQFLVLGNSEELRTVICNLFDNAVKYSGDAKDIVVDFQTPNLDSVALRVRDKGVGIPRGEIKRIFSRFHRIQTLKTRQVKGTGLGLFIVRSVVRRYGGEAYAESAGEGQGSTFVIRLPRLFRV